MPRFEVYIPAVAADFPVDLTHLKAQGVDIERHNLANDPTAFATDETVRSFLQVAGSEGLPLTLVDGVTVATGTYPNRDQLLKFAGGAATQPVMPVGATTLGLLDAPTVTDAGCGCGPEGCS